MDWTYPTTARRYDTEVFADIKARDEAAVSLFEIGGSDTNIPDGAKRLNTSTYRIQRCESDAWSDYYLVPRLPNNTWMLARNGSDSADVSVLKLDASDGLMLNSLGATSIQSSGSTRAAFNATESSSSPAANIYSANGTIGLMLGTGSTSALTADQASGVLRFNGASVAWGDLAFYPNATGTSDKGRWRFSTTGGALSSTPGGRVGMGELYLEDSRIVSATDLTFQGGRLFPNSNNSQDIGAASLRWRQMCFQYLNLSAARVTAAGTTAAGATALSSFLNKVITATSGASDGVKLPTPISTGHAVWVSNSSSSGVVYVYPHTGASIESGGANIPIGIGNTLSTGTSMLFWWDGSVWRYILLA